ncbi:hypothetical protein [Serratia sp. S4]|uniref:hypothetical protein n=1 Tax=Serratia sp. S4 TaxID=768491 RepID=UPI00155A4100|nr:hypothetical protein [Serratia sp. S4]
MNSHIVSIDGNKIELNIDVNVLNAQENKSEWLVLGSLKVMNKNYAIYRKMFISNNNTDFIGFTNSIITREERHPLDNTPDEVWQQYILPERPGVEFYLEQKRLNKNRVLFKGLDNPYFLCTIIEN